MNGWSFAYEGYEPGQEGLREVLCATGNGSFVTRAAPPDCRADAVHYPGTYLAGGYNRLTSELGGRQIENEDLVNLPNWLSLSIRIADGDWIDPDHVEMLGYRQELSLREGVLYRRLRFRDGQGRTTRWEERRFVSMADAHTAAIAVRIVAEDWSGRLTVRSGLDGAVVNAGVRRYRELKNRHLETLNLEQPDEDILFLRSRMVQSRREIGLAARTRLYRDAKAMTPKRRTERSAHTIRQEAELEMTPGEGVDVEKLVALFGSRAPAITEAGEEACDQARDYPRFDDLLTPHVTYWQHLWDACNVSLETAAEHDHRVARTLRLHIFHLLQTVSPHSVNLDIGVPARGWHGEAYRGHIFWDELFILPLLTLRLPALAESLLRYRYRRLPAARRAASAAGFRGAMFPWQSGSNGREETQRYHLNPASGRWLPDNSHRQRHINAAIAYNVWHYYQATGDHELMYYCGAEMLLEIARFWASVASYNEATGRYDIRGVMGPDEFHTAYPGRDPSTEGGIDNNAYTNVMAAWTLAVTLDLLDQLPDERARHLRERLEIDAEELELWDAISRKLRVPFHDDGIISQFEGYEALEEFDWQSARERHGDIQRLDRILEADNDDPNRYKVSKQADVLMLFYVFSSQQLQELLERLGYDFDPKLIPRNIEYYAARTSHGSTLSWVVHAWVQARADRGASWDLFCQAVKSDVADIQGGTTPEGIHLGAMAGTVDVVQRCYTGLEVRGDALHIDPALPDDLACLETTIQYRRHMLEIRIDHRWLSIRSRPFNGPPVTLAYRGHYRALSPGQSCSFRLVPPPAQRVGTTGLPS